MDQAKDWAKRLLKHGSFKQLSAAQNAVAVMLGHASWHALSKAPPSSPAMPASPKGAEPAAPDTRPLWDQLEDIINARHPGLGGGSLVGMARDLDLLQDTPAALAYTIETHHDAGALLDEAVAEALEGATQRIVPPPGHIFVQMETAKGRILITLPQDAWPASVTP